MDTNDMFLQLDDNGNADKLLIGNVTEIETATEVWPYGLNIDEFDMEAIRQIMRDNVLRTANTLQKQLTEAEIHRAIYRSIIVYIGMYKDEIEN